MRLNFAAVVAAAVLTSAPTSAEYTPQAYTPIPPYDALSGVFVITGLYNRAGYVGEVRILVGNAPTECLALSREYGWGYWGWSNNGFQIVFRGEDFIYGNHAEIPISYDTIDISGCSINGYKGRDQFDAAVESLRSEAQ